MDSLWIIGIFDKYSQRFHCQKVDICNNAEFCSTVQLQIVSFVKISLWHPVGLSLKENKISCPFFNTLKVSHIAVAAQLQQVSYPDKFLSRFHVSQVDNYNLHLLH